MTLRGMPLPEPDHDTRPFWEGCRERRFLIPFCSSCNTPRWPPGPMCPACRSPETRWAAASGRGSVYSWIVAAHPVDPVLVDQVPYAVGLVDLEEGVRVVGNIAGVAPHEITAGMPVELFFEEREDGFLLPNFQATEQPRRGKV